MRRVAWGARLRYGSAVSYGGISMSRFLTLLVLCAGLGACTASRDLTKPPEPIGRFLLGHAIVVAPNLVKGPVSREASPEEWIAGVDKALEDRFRRYEGDWYYHMGISVEGYVLAQPGIPLVLSPKSALILNVTLWDDRAGVKLNEEPRQITVLESFSAETALGSGLTQSKEEQLQNLSFNAALQIERWMRVRLANDDWFMPEGPGVDRTAYDEAQPVGEAAPAASAPLATMVGAPGSRPESRILVQTLPQPVPESAPQPGPEPVIARAGR